MRFGVGHAQTCKLKRLLGSPVALLVILIACGAAPAHAQQSAASTEVRNAPLSVDQVVANLVGKNLARTQALHAYNAKRIYRVDYRGFPSNRHAEMAVDVRYSAPGKKVFKIESTTGSKLIIDKVLKKLLEAEEEAQAADMQRRTALNSSNYAFKMVGYETTPRGSIYVLAVEPRTSDKFLYRGRIWVDGGDFAVIRLQGEPAKNPSFWIKNSQIEQLYMKVNDFWLPKQNHSVTAIRLGGRAELTIDYSNYEVTEAVAVAKLPTENASVAQRETGPDSGR
jgi:hypothetical protein